MPKSYQLLIVAVLLAANAAVAEPPEEGMIAPTPPPPEIQPSSPDRITPPEGDTKASGIMTTHEAPAQPEMPVGVSPFQNVPSGETAAPKPPPAAYMPFKHAEPAGPVIPSAPHSTVAVPVEDVDAVESSEAAPPTPVAPEADPAQEDPAQPTELTSPIFQAETGTQAPRKIILRALNKVTAQSETLTLKPNETVKFGQLEITAVNCQVSSSTSQTDYAGLLDISEKLPGKEELKPLFRGWMYASSPSITSLEHPVYDVSMAECKVMPAVVKDEKKDDKKTGKDDAKPKKKAKN